MAFWLDACLRAYGSSDWFGNVLFDSVLQPMRSMTYIPTVKVARKLVNYIITLLKGRKYNIFLVCETQIFRGINNTWFHSSKVCFVV